MNIQNVAFFKLLPVRQAMVNETFMADFKSKPMLLSTLKSSFFNPKSYAIKLKRISIPYNKIVSFAFSRRYSVGDISYTFLNALENFPIFS